MSVFCQRSFLSQAGFKPVFLENLDGITQLYLHLILPSSLNFDSFLANCSPCLICLIWLCKCSA